jgi:ATP-dependent RNA helicase DDX51/DBP6
MADSELTAHILGLPRGVRGCYQTLLFSATLTKDPSKLGALRLRNPLFFTAGTPSHHPTEDGSAPAKSFTVAAGLKEYLIVTTVQDKPLALLHLLQKRDQQHSPTLVFCASVEATHRLFRLLELLFAADQSAGKRVTPVAEYSSVLPQNARTAILARFRAGTVRTLICSDAMARGMDVDGVALVVNYDCPVFARTYVHRCGRTARGGREGEAVTLCRPEEVRHFKALLRKIEGARTQQLTLQHDMLHPAKKKYAAALNALKEVIRCERIGEQHSAQPLKSSRLTDLRARFVRLAEPTPRVTEPSAAKAEAIEGAVDEGVDDIEALSATLLTAAGETEEVDDEVDE